MLLIYKKRRVFIGATLKWSKVTQKLRKSYFAPLHVVNLQKKASFYWCNMKIAQGYTKLRNSGLHYVKALRN